MNDDELYNNETENLFRNHQHHINTKESKDYFVDKIYSEDYLYFYEKKYELALEWLYINDFGDTLCQFHIMKNDKYDYSLILFSTQHTHENHEIIFGGFSNSLFKDKDRIITIFEEIFDRYGSEIIPYCAPSSINREVFIPEQHLKDLFLRGFSTDILSQIKEELENINSNSQVSLKDKLDYERRSSLQILKTGQPLEKKYNDKNIRDIDLSFFDEWWRSTNLQV
tara:strand:- start:332 stop:1006 length:675 start_codon:yes stop_codon:yes gene_type:complete